MIRHPITLFWYHVTKNSWHHVTQNYLHKPNGKKLISIKYLCYVLAGDQTRTPTTPEGNINHLCNQDRLTVSTYTYLLFNKYIPKTKRVTNAIDNSTQNTVPEQMENLHAWHADMS